jgi:SAM-dependent methyltransferase
VPARYDTIGLNYANLRQPDARIQAAIDQALGPAKTVLNVGAGAGSYEPANRDVTAVEPSEEMIRQRPANAAPVIRGTAEELPFEDKSFDACMAVLTVHHWSDQAKGLREMRRVTRGPVVLLTYDPSFRGFWLADYVPQLIDLDERRMPRLAEYEACLGSVSITDVPIPQDCTDGFLCAYWRRPFAYLDPEVRKAMSSFWLIGDVSIAMARLEADLNDGSWAKRYGDLEELDACDLGYRLVVSQ